MTITNGYTDLATLRSELGSYITADTGDDAKIERSVEAASRQIDGWCGQRFWKDATVVTSEFYAESPRCCPVDVDGRAGIGSTSGLVVKIDDDGDGTFETTLTISTDFILRPTNNPDETPVMPWTEVWLADNYLFPCHANGRPAVQVVSIFGWPAVPDDVEKACIIQAEMLFKAKDAPLGVAGFDQMGSAMRVRSDLHPMAKALLAPYRKPAVG